MVLVVTKWLSYLEGVFPDRILFNLLGNGFHSLKLFLSALKRLYLLGSGSPC